MWRDLSKTAQDGAVRDEQNSTLSTVKHHDRGLHGWLSSASLAECTHAPHTAYSAAAPVRGALHGTRRARAARSPQAAAQSPPL